jgi:hypothetical protein
MFDLAALALLLAVLPITVLALCACCAHKSGSLAPVGSKRKQPENIIPPLFFTEGVNPLFQEDLKEHIPDAQLTTPDV